MRDYEQVWLRAYCSALALSSGDELVRSRSSAVHAELALSAFHNHFPRKPDRAQEAIVPIEELQKLRGIACAVRELRATIVGVAAQANELYAALDELDELIGGAP